MILAPGMAAAQGVTLSARAAGTTVALDADAVPSSFTGERLWSLLDWHTARAGLTWSEMEISAGVLRIPVRAIVVRIDPRLYRFRLELATRSNGMTGAWTVDSVSADVALALNAGQFKETGPWGCVVNRPGIAGDPNA